MYRAFCFIASYAFVFVLSADGGEPSRSTAVVSHLASNLLFDFFLSQGLLPGAVKATPKCLGSVCVKLCVNRLFKILKAF